MTYENDTIGYFGFSLPFYINRSCYEITISINKNLFCPKTRPKNLGQTKTRSSDFDLAKT